MAAGLPGYQRWPWVSAAAPDPRPDLRQLRPWGPLRGSERGRDLRRGSGCPGRLRDPWAGSWGRCGDLSAGRISGGAPVALEGCGPSWVPARALGECCGIRIRVRGSGSCFGGVLPKDLRQLRPWGRCGGSERGPGSGSCFGVRIRTLPAAAALGPLRGLGLSCLSFCFGPCTIRRAPIFANIV